MRTYGIGESHVADIHRSAGGDPPGVETSICARSFEIEIDIRADPGHEAAGEALAATMRAELGDHVFSTDERPLAEIVLDLLAGAGMDRARPPSRAPAGWSPPPSPTSPGARTAFTGGVVAYSNALKRDLLASPRASSRSTAP